jgi:hypothetical protein
MPRGLLTVLSAFSLLLCVGPAFWACGGCNSSHPGRLIAVEDVGDRYIELRKGRGSYVMTRPGTVKGRPELTRMREVHGDLEFICTEVHPGGRIVVESKNRARYQVLYTWADKGNVLDVIAEAVGLVVAREEREVWAVAIRVPPSGHRLQPAPEGEAAEPWDAGTGEEVLHITMDDLTRDMETRWRRPAVNLTALEGRWLVRLSSRARMIGRNLGDGDVVPLEDTGLELRLEKVRLPVIVVMDKKKTRRL